MIKPEVVQLQYGSPEHNRIREAIRQRVKMSKDKLGDRYAKWAEMEDRAQAYIKPTEGDAARAVTRKSGKPQYTTLEIPYSYSMLLSAHTYWTSVFLGRTPVMQFEGRHAEPANQVRAIEALIDYQLTAANWLVPLYIWLLDMGKYGLGVVGNYWVDEYAITSETVEVDVSYFGIKTGAKKRQRNTIRIPGYAGNRLFNVRPQDFLPDPRVSIARFQEGEYCGRRTEIGWNTILKRVADGTYYNKDAVRGNMDKWGMNKEAGSSNLVLPDAMATFYAPPSHDDGTSAKSGFELIEMTIELVPQDWGLGQSKYPEKWCFSMINDEVVVGAQPQGLYHNQFGYDVIEYEMEGYALGKRSMLEMLDPLNNALSWLFNSHMHNVRKVMNDQMVVDPSKIVMNDLTNPDAGRLIRLRPDAYGTDTRLAVSQLQVTDVTRNHLQDAQVVIEMMQKLVGVVDNIMGSVNSGGRKTATEVRTSSSFGVNRLKTTCEYASAMGFGPLSAKLLQNTQQKYDGEKQFNIAGELLATKTPIRVTPDIIAGFYDFVPIDGTMPVDRFAQASLWKELLGLFLKAPQLAAGYDMPGIMGLVANLSGVKNFDQYRLAPPQIASRPDEDIQNEVRKGNLVPINGGGGGTNTGTTSGGATRDFTQLSQAGSVAGVGRAG